MKKRKIIWNNHISDNGNYIIDCSSDYTDEKLVIEVPQGTNYDRFHNLVDNDVYEYLVKVHNDILEREPQGMGLSDNVSISGSLVCHNLYKSYIYALV